MSIDTQKMWKKNWKTEKEIIINLFKPKNSTVSYHVIRTNNTNFD